MDGESSQGSIEEMKSKKSESLATLASLYPNIARFVESWGYITLGRDEDSFDPVFVRALDPGGTIWEGKYSYQSVDDALRDLEKGLAKWMRKEGVEK